MIFDALEFESGPAPTASMIVLHGLGADADDLAPVAQMLRFPFAVRFVLPNAPVRPVTLNNGYPMPAWYDIGAGGVEGSDEPTGLSDSVRTIEALVARELERGIAAKNIVVAGFSQGCALSLTVAVRSTRALGAICGMSGYLPPTVDAAGTDASRRTPIWLAHGIHDPVVPVQRGRAARDALTQAGHAVAWNEYPIDHSICEPEIARLNAFVLGALRGGAT